MLNIRKIKQHEDGWLCILEALPCFDAESPENEAT